MDEASQCAHTHSSPVLAQFNIYTVLRPLSNNQAQPLKVAPRKFLDVAQVVEDFLDVSKYS